MSPPEVNLIYQAGGDVQVAVCTSCKQLLFREKPQDLRTVRFFSEEAKVRGAAVGSDGDHCPGACSETHGIWDEIRITKVPKLV